MFGFFIVGSKSYYCIMECKKVKFATEKDCEFYIKKLKKTSNRDVKPIRAYMCTYCSAWHLTSRESFESVKIKELTETVHKLKQEINLLQGKDNKEINKELKKDERVTQLCKTISIKNNIIGRLRKTNKDLICENLTLSRKLQPTLS